jgi:hypothetical protein
VFDLCAVLGTNVVTSIWPGLKIFGIFKLSRVLRLGNMISKMNVPEEVKALMNLGKLTFYLYMFMHVLGCAFYMVIVLNKDTVDKDGIS